MPPRPASPRDRARRVARAQGLARRQRDARVAQTIASVVVRVRVVALRIRTRIGAERQESVVVGLGHRRALLARVRAALARFGVRSRDVGSRVDSSNGTRAPRITVRNGPVASSSTHRAPSGHISTSSGPALTITSTSLLRTAARPPRCSRRAAAACAAGLAWSPRLGVLLRAVEHHLEVAGASARARRAACEVLLEERARKATARYQRGGAASSRSTSATTGSSSSACRTNGSARVSAGATSFDVPTRSMATTTATSALTTTKVIRSRLANLSSGGMANTSSTTRLLADTPERAHDQAAGAAELPSRFMTPSSRVALMKFAAEEKSELRRARQRAEQRKLSKAATLPSLSLERRLRDSGDALAAAVEVEEDDADPKSDLVSHYARECESLMRRRKIRSKRPRMVPPKGADAADADGASARARPARARAKYTAPQAWRGRRNSFCEMCLLPVSFCASVDAGCRVCPVVVCSGCVPAHERGLALAGTWSCDDCLEQMEEAHSAYLNTRGEEYMIAARDKYAVVMAKYWRGRLQRLRYRKIQRAMLRMQSMARCYVHRSAFVQHRRMECRPARLAIVRAKGLAVADWDNGLSDPYVIATVLDAKNRQVWRHTSKTVHDSLRPAFGDECLVPRVWGACKLVLTVIDDDDCRDQLLGQCVVDFERDSTVWRAGGARGDGARPARLHAEGGLGRRGALRRLARARGPRARHAHLPALHPGRHRHDRRHPARAAARRARRRRPGRRAPRGRAATQQARLRRSYGVLFDGKLSLFRTASDMSPRVVLALPQCRVKIHHEPKAATLEVEIKAKSYAVKLSFPSLQNRWRSALELAITERPPTFPSCVALFTLATWRRDVKRPWKGAELQRREATNKGAYAQSAGAPG